jgi:prephenate dehydrogenase
MFGSQQTGIEHADAALLTPDTRCWLTPTRVTGSAATLTVRRFWTALGVKVGTMTPAEHDRRLARASHATQVVASALAAAQTGDSISSAGRGLLDTTRLAGSDAALWVDVLLSNRKAVSAELKRVIAELESVASGLDSGQPGPVRSLIRRGNTARRAIARHFGVAS